MTCPSVQDDLKAYLDGELPPLRRLAVRRHLSGCAVCREEVQIMEVLQTELRAGEKEHALAPELRTRILEQVAGHVPDAPAPSAPPRRSWLGSPALAWSAAVFVLLGWLVLAPFFSKAREESSEMTHSKVQAFRPAERPALKSAPATLSSPQDADEGDYAAPMSAASPAPERLVPPEAQSQPPVAAAVSSDAADSALRRVHKEASLTVVVGNPETQSDAVEQMVKSSGGYVADNTLTTDDGGRKSAQMTLKVPEPQFEAILGQIAKLGAVQAKNITGQDITAQVSDAGQAENVLESEAQQAQARLNKLGTKAKWEDDEQARDLRIQLAQARARLQLLQKMAALATVSLTLDEKPQPVPPAAGGFSSQLTGTTHAALESLAASAGALLTLPIWLAAYAPLWIPAALVTRHFLRLSRRRGPAPPP